MNAASSSYILEKTSAIYYAPTRGGQNAPDRSNRPEYFEHRNQNVNIVPQITSIKYSQHWASVFFLPSSFITISHVRIVDFVFETNSKRKVVLAEYFIIEYQLVSLSLSLLLKHA